MLMHSYLAPRAENKRWTAKIWSQQTKLSGRDQQTWWLWRYVQTNACWLGVLHCVLFFPPVISFLSLSTYRNFYLCCFSPLPLYLFSFFVSSELNVLQTCTCTVYKDCKMVVRNFWCRMVEDQLTATVLPHLRFLSSSSFLKNSWWTLFITPPLVTAQQSLLKSGVHK